MFCAALQIMLCKSDLNRQIRILSNRLNSLQKNLGSTVEYWDPEADPPSVDQEPVDQEPEDNIKTIFRLSGDRKVLRKEKNQGCNGWEIKAMKETNDNYNILALGFRHDELYKVEFLDEGNSKICVHCTKVQNGRGVVEKKCAETPQKLIDWLDDFFAI